MNLNLNSQSARRLKAIGCLLVAIVILGVILAHHPKRRGPSIPSARVAGPPPSRATPGAPTPSGTTVTGVPRAFTASQGEAVVRPLPPVPSTSASKLPYIPVKKAEYGAQGAPTADARSSPAPSAESGTLMMYRAHASLRTSEVSDPNSEGNRQVLTTMVAKALQNMKGGSPLK